MSIPSIIIPPSSFHEMQSAWIRQTLVLGGGSGASCLTWLIRGGTWAIDPAVQGLSCPAIVISPCLSPLSPCLAYVHLSLSPESLPVPIFQFTNGAKRHEPCHPIHPTTGQILLGSCWVPAGTAASAASLFLAAPHQVAANSEMV